MQDLYVYQKLIHTYTHFVQDTWPTYHWEHRVVSLTFLLKHIIGHKVNKTSHMLSVVFHAVMCFIDTVTKQSKEQMADYVAYLYYLYTLWSVLITYI